MPKIDKRTLLERLESRAIPEPNSGCLLWMGSISTAGYGAMSYHGFQEAAHRLAWQAANGAIPRGLLVCHKCDVRTCINPGHLFLGSHLDNMADRVHKVTGKMRRDPLKTMRSIGLVGQK